MAHTAADIQTALLAVGRNADLGRCALLSADLRSTGDLDRAIAQLRNDERHDSLTFALSYRAALAEAADPMVMVRRLRTEASDLQYRADKMMADGAENAGKAADRLAKGQLALAADYQRSADAAERAGAALTDDAAAKHAQADDIERREASKKAFRDVSNLIAAE